LIIAVSFQYLPKTIIKARSKRCPTKKCRGRKTSAPLILALGLWSRKVITVTNAQVICMAWTDILSDFVRSTHGELLVMSPWITTAAARLISQGLAGTGPVKLQIIARLDESDFVTGASHVDAFRPQIYPPNARPDFRALPMLHGKMLLSDRKRVIIGSANMTDGGLYRNHEVCLLLDSSEIGQDCRMLSSSFGTWRHLYPQIISVALSRFWRKHVRIQMKRLLKPKSQVGVSASEPYDELRGSSM